MLWTPISKKLRDYVSEHKIDFDEDTTEPCLDALWWHYGEYHSLSNAKTKQGFRDLYDALNCLGPKASDEVIGMVGCLCAEHERLAFIAGFRLGAQLMLEITEPDESDI